MIRNLMKKALAILLIVVFCIVGVSCSDKGKTDPTLTKKAETSSKTTTKTTAKSTTSQKTTTKITTRGSETPGNQDVQPGGGDKGDTSDEEIPETPGIFEEIIDLKGRVISMVSWWDTAPKPDGNIWHAAVYKSLMEAQEKFNFTFEFSIVSPAAAMIQTVTSDVLAGLNTYDMVFSQAVQTFPALTKNNIIVPIDDYIDFNCELLRDVASTVEFNGKHWGTPISAYQPAIGGVLFSRRFMEQWGLPNPQDLYDEGKWNWDSMLEIGRLATVDLNGDGVIDNWGMQAVGQILTYSLILANGMPIYSENNGRLELNMETPQAIRAMQYMSDLVFTHKVCTILRSASKNTLFQNGQCAMWIVNSGAFNMNYCQGTGMGSVGYVPMPLGPDATSRINYSQSSTFPSYLSSCEDIENVVKAMTYVYSIWNPSNAGYTSLDDRGRMDWEVWSGEEVYAPGRELTTEEERDVQFMKISDSNPTVMPFPNSLTNIIRNNIVNPMVAGRDPVSTIIYSATPIIQAEIDSLFN